jgi:hypothetical protein
MIDMVGLLYIAGNWELGTGNWELFNLAHGTWHMDFMENRAR